MKEGDWWWRWWRRFIRKQEQLQFRWFTVQVLIPSSSWSGLVLIQSSSWSGLAQYSYDLMWLVQHSCGSVQLVHVRNSAEPRCVLAPVHQTEVQNLTVWPVVPTEPVLGSSCSLLGSGSGSVRKRRALRPPELVQVWILQAKSVEGVINGSSAKTETHNIKLNES